MLYVLVALSTSPVASHESVAGSEGALLEVVKQGPFGIPPWLFAAIALVAVTNTCLVTMVTQSRILYGMANEDVVPRVFGKVHPKRQTPWVGILFTFVMVVGLLLAAGAEVETLASASVVFLLFIYGLVIISALKLRREDDDHPDSSFRAPTPLLYVGRRTFQRLLRSGLRVDLGVVAHLGGQPPQVVVTVAEEVVERGEVAGVVADGVLRGHPDAAVQLDRLLADVPT